MVTISRAEYERLQQENAQLEAKNAKLEEAHARLEAKLATLEQEQAQVITSLTLQNEWLLEQLKLSKKKLFGRSSEQAEQLVMDQLSLTMNGNGSLAMYWMLFLKGRLPRWWSTVCRRMNGSALPAAARW